MGRVEAERIHKRNLDLTPAAHAVLNRIYAKAFVKKRNDEKTNKRDQKTNDLEQIVAQI